VTLSNRKKIFLYYAFIVAVNLIIYAPSLSHLPRSDHFVYLANTAQENGWVSLAWKHYAFNREVLAFGIKDTLLFRPLVCILLGTEKHFFGYEFIYWQATGILLHMVVLWCLLNILWRISPGLPAATASLFFSVLLSNAELVTWQHVHGYFVCLLAVLIAFDQILKSHQTNLLPRRGLFILFLALLFACFSHEIGFIYSLLFTLYLLFPSKTKSQGFSNKYLAPLTAALPCLIYVSLNILDLQHRGLLSTISPSALKTNSVLYGLWVAPGALFWWAYIGLFPTLTFTELAQRTFMYPIFINIKGYSFQPSMALLFPAILSLSAVTIYLVYLKKYLTLDFIKKIWAIWILLLSMVFSFAFLVGYGRASVKGFQRIMVDNGSYNYFFWTFFIILIYIALPFREIKLRHQRAILLISALVILISFNAYGTFRLNTLRTVQSHNQSMLLRQIKKLIRLHSMENNFSFAVHPNSQKNLVWYTKTEDPTGRRYTFVEFLYPSYYNEDQPKYLFQYIENIGWDWKTP
jgi:hypothetical protein